MVLMRSNKVPEDAVILDEGDAITYAWDIVTNWESFSDTWALRYSSVVLGAINSLSGILINNHYRNKLKLGTYGYFASVIPISVMPGLLTALFHRHTVSTEMLLMKRDACPLCYEMKSAFLQCSLGIAYPMLLAPTSGMMLANRYSTTRMPELMAGPKEVFKFLRKITKPITGTLMILCIGQLVASSVLTYFEMRNNYTMRKKILEIEKNIMIERGLEVS